MDATIIDMTERAESNQLEELLASLHRYEVVCAPDLPMVTLYSNGSGFISTTQAGAVYQFASVRDAVGWLG